MQYLILFLLLLIYLQTSPDKSVAAPVDPATAQLNAYVLGVLIVALIVAFPVILRWMRRR